MAPITAMPRKATRTTGNPSTSSNNIHPTISEPRNLNTASSDDSSVFSGLGLEFAANGSLLKGSSDKDSKNVRVADEEQEEKEEGSHRSRPTRVGRYHTKLQRTQDSQHDDDGTRTEFLRNMQPVADKDSAFGLGTGSDATEGESVIDRKHGNRVTYMSSDMNFLQDQDASTMSYGSVNEISRPRGTVQMVSEVQFFDDEEEEVQGGHDEEVMPPEGEDRITTMLNAYERQMDANLEVIKEEEDYLSELQDAIPRRAKSEDECQSLTHQQAKKMQRILHQARREVETLRDNNEQFMSEIEQTEEENESEKKLHDERTKQKLSDLKAMYQDEMDALVKEKDASIVEAGRQAVRFAESGRKQITSLKRQIEKQKAQANGTIKQNIEDAVSTVKRKGEEEMTARLGALRNSYESELEKMRSEREIRVKDAVNEAISNVTQRMLADRDREVNETITMLRSRLENERNDSFRSVNTTLDHSRREISELRQERDALFMALVSVKENVNKHYPEQMEQLRQNSQNTSNPMKILQAGRPTETTVEALFKEVIEAFAFLLDTSETKASSAQYLGEVEEIKKERNEVYIKARKELMIRHRADTLHLRKQQEDSKDKMHRLEESLKNMGRDKRVVEDKYRKATDRHRVEIQRMQSEKEAILEVEKGRKELSVAMAAGPLEPAHTMASGREHFLKPYVVETESTKSSMENENGSHQHYVASEVKATTGDHHVNEESVESRDDVEQSRSADAPFRSSASEECESQMGGANGSCSEEEEKPSRQQQEAHFQIPSTAKNNAERSLTSLPPPPPPPPPLRPVALEKREHQAEGFDAMKSPSIDSYEHKTSCSDVSGSSCKRTKRTVLVRVKNQAKEASKSKKPEEASKTKKEPAGSKDPAAAELLKRKSFGILRSFKSQKGSPTSKPKDPETSTQGKDPEGKTEVSSHTTRSAGRRAKTNKLRNFFDTIKGDSSHHRRDSFTDESLSSLKADPGVSSPHSKAQRKLRMVSLPPDERDDCDSLLAERQGEGNESRDSESSEHTRSSNRKKKNPLGMFANAKKAKDSPEKVESEDTEQPEEETAPFEDEVLTKPSIVQKESLSSNDHSGTSDILKLKKGLPPSHSTTEPSTTSMISQDENEQLNATTREDLTSPLRSLRKPPLSGFEGNGRDKSPPRPHAIKPTETTREDITTSLRSLRKPPLSGFEVNGGDKSPPRPHVINGKKPPLPEWAKNGSKDHHIMFAPESPSPQPVSSGSFSDAENQVPATIAVRAHPGHPKHQLVTPATNGHTMCLRPLSVVNATKGISCMGSDGYPNTSGVTSDTATSTDDDGGGHHGYGPTTHSQMRNYPPLGDDSDDDDDSFTDRYETFEPPAQFAREYGSPEHKAGKHVPIVISRSVDESPVLYMDTSLESSSRPIVVQGQPIYRQPALSAFDPRRDHASDTSSTAGSEATTAITAHTFRSSPYPTSSDSAPQHVRDHLRNHSKRTSLPTSPAGVNAGFTRRSTALAAMKARRSSASRRSADI